MITHQDLKASLHYDPATGLFTRIIARPRSPKGSVAGRVSHLGYREIRINRARYQAHRLAWLYVHGEWPNGDIDHINRIRSDNRLCNLRVASRAENLRNAPVKSNSKTGIKGVSLHKLSGKYRAAIRTSAGRKHLGLFYTAEEAEAAYNAAADKYHGEFSCKERCNGPLPNSPPAPRPKIGAHKAATKRSATGFRGISPVGNKYRAQICAAGVKKHLGYYSTRELAAAAYAKAANAANADNGEFAPTA